MNDLLIFLIFVFIDWIGAKPRNKGKKEKEKNYQKQYRTTDQPENVQTGSATTISICIVGGIVLFVALVLVFYFYNKRRNENAVQLPGEPTLTDVPVPPSSVASAFSSNQNQVDQTAQASSTVVGQPVNALVAKSSAVPSATPQTAVALEKVVQEKRGSDETISVEISDPDRKPESSADPKTSQAPIPHWQSDPSSSKPSSSWSLTDLEPYKKHVFKNESDEECGVCRSKTSKKSKKKTTRTSCSRCKQVSHDEDICKEVLAKPCSARNDKPTSPIFKITRKIHHHELNEIVPKSGAKVPAALIYCTANIEKKLGEDVMNANIYFDQKEATDEVKKVTDKLRYDLNWPSLDKHNPTFIANCVKRFLHKLKDPLIPKSKLPQFVQCVIQSSDETKFNQALKKISTAERDTLAHMMNHLQKLIKTDDDREKLSTIFAPLIMGEDSTEIESKAVEIMLRADPSIWNNILLASSKCP